MPTFTVKASEPTVLRGRTHYELSPTDLTLAFRVDTSHIVPGAIDFERFQAALAATLAVYPLAAGRLERPRDVSQPWKVRLSNEGIPLTTIDSDVDQEVPVDTIIQSPWTLTKPVDVIRLLDYKSEEPLLKVTLIRFTKTGSTSIGCSSSHLIGDGFMVLRFVRLLSQNYQCLPPLDIAPSYDSISISPEKVGGRPIPALDTEYPGSASKDIRSLKPSAIKFTRVDIRLKANQIAQIHRAVMAQAQKKSRADNVDSLSRQDTLIGLLAICISRADPTSPIRHICNIIMSRGISPRPNNAACNALLGATVDVPENLKSIYSIGRSLRKAVHTAHDPAYAAAYDTARGRIVQEHANNDKCQDLTPPPGYMVVNSTWKFDWTSAHFGYPGRARFYHTVFGAPRYIKIFQPNPTLLANGDWESHPGDAEITFYLRYGTDKAFRQALNEELRTLGVEGNVEFISS